MSINGTSLQALIDARCAAAIAIEDALVRLGECAPHGRDFSANPNGYLQAVKIYHQRYVALAQLAADLRREAEMISEGKENRT